MYRLRCIMLAMLLYVSTISAAVLTPPEVLSPEQYLANQGQPPPYDSTVRLNLTDVLSNTSTMAHNITNGNSLLRADCNGRRYGVHVNSRSCFNALRLIPRTNEQLYFGMRYTPAGLASTIKLPYRWLSPDGLCSVQLYLIGTVQKAHASLLEIAQAADLIYAKCVASDANLGGFALEIGGDNELGVVMQKNFPGDVHCLPRPAPRPFTCRNIVDTILATSRRELFGPGGDPQVEAALPAVFSDGKDSLFEVFVVDRRILLDELRRRETALTMIEFVAREECFATIKDPTRGSSYASWYKMWEAITTIYWMCMAGSVPLTGKAFGIGSARSIEMILSDRPER